MRIREYSVMFDEEEGCPERRKRQSLIRLRWRERIESWMSNKRPESSNDCVSRPSFQLAGASTSFVQIQKWCPPRSITNGNLVLFVFFACIVCLSFSATRVLPCAAFSKTQQLFLFLRNGPTRGRGLRRIQRSPTAWKWVPKWSLTE